MATTAKMNPRITNDPAYDYLVAPVLQPGPGGQALQASHTEFSSERGDKSPSYRQASPMPGDHTHGCLWHEVL